MSGERFKGNAVGPEGFWEEMSLGAPRVWLVACVVGLLAALSGIPSDLSTFTPATLLPALLFRSVFIAYFLINIVLCLKFKSFITRYSVFLMTGAIYLTGIPIGLMGALTGDPANYYFMGIIEVEFAVATFFTIPRVQLIGGVVSINLFYILSHILLIESFSFARFGNILVSLLIFAFLAIYAHFTILQGKMANFRKRQELRDIFSRITDAFFALDNQWRFQYFNPEAEKLLLRMNRPKETLLNQSLWEQFPNLSDSTMRNEFLRSKAEMIPVTFDEFYPLINAHMEVHAYPSPEGMSVYMNDVTTRKAAEAALLKSQQELEQRVAARTAELRELATYADNLREEEWKNISREIHDELGQALSSFNLGLDWLKEQLGHTGPKVLDKLAFMSKNAREMVETVRKIAADLRPAALDDLGLADTVEWYILSMKEKCGKIRFDYRIEPDEIVIDADRSVALYRILQEGLNNVVRHARATRVIVSLRQTEKNMSLEIRDDGIGLDAQAATGPRRGGKLGLLGMKERTERFGGQFILESRPGEGTLLKVEIPCESVKGGTG